MSVFKRKTSNGFTENYHYRFYHAGKIYSGICENCLTRQDALKFEKNKRDKIKSAVSVARKQRATKTEIQKTVSSIIKSDSCRSIALDDAFEESLRKPKKRRAKGAFLQAKRTYWRDFTAFMKDILKKDVPVLSDVERAHAQSYISYNIRENGRYQKEIVWNRRGKAGEKYLRKGNFRILIK